MEPYHLAVEAVIDAATAEVDDVITEDLDDVTKVRLSISGGLAERSQGLGWHPYQCAFCGAGMPVGNSACERCGKNNVVHTPLFWAASAEILVDSDSETVLLRLNLATGGILQMEVSKTDDGRLFIHTPRAGVIQGGETVVHRLSDGAYEIKEG
jgi:hypothetical protein